MSQTQTAKTIDVRQIPPRERHSLIFQTYYALRPKESFELVNDHDPKPLYYQFAAEHPDKFTWEYLEQGPDVWRVRVGKTAEVADTAKTHKGCC